MVAQHHILAHVVILSAAKDLALFFACKGRTKATCFAKFTLSPFALAQGRSQQNGERAQHDRHLIGFMVRAFRTSAPRQGTCQRLTYQHLNPMRDGLLAKRRIGRGRAIITSPWTRVSAAARLWMP